MTSLRTSLGGIELGNCIYNASGPRTGTAAALNKIATSASGAVLAKSATLESQKGNPLPRVWQNDKVASLNSEGLPNSGIDYYINSETISEAMEGITCDKPYMVSISGKTLEDNLVMLDHILDAVNNKKAPIQGVELNLACPNVIGKPIIAYDFAQMDSVLAAVSQKWKQAKNNSSMILGVKMPPYFDGPHFEQAASVLNKYKKVVSYSASINTIGNAFVVDTHAEMPVISSKGGFAGLSGPAVKYTALANVKMMRTLLAPEIDVVGVGGVETGEDAFNMILCGAAAVQVGTCHWIEGPKCFDRITMELQQLMKQKGYNSLDDFKGKLKSWSKEGAALSRAASKMKADGSGAATSDSSSPATNPLIVPVLVGVIAAQFAYIIYHLQHQREEQ